MNKILQNYWQNTCVLIILIGVIFTSFYKLSESPQTWTDEGLIIQTSQNLATQGIYGFQIAPGKIISPSFISTSYPVTYPIALSFKLFGVSLFNARLVMALYIISLLIVTLFLFIRENKEKLIWTLLLIGSFPPVYGHGKNVLGEIPGLFLILVSAFFLRRIEEGKDLLINWSGFALFFGLALSTKPIFILAVPSFLFVVWMRFFYKKSIENIEIKKLAIVFGLALIPLIVWVSVQFFPTDGWRSIIHYYSNPHSVNIFSAIKINLKDFLTHIRTLFAGGTFALWTLIIGYSYYKDKKIPLFEAHLYVLSLLVFVFYFRNPPYYRYFFITEGLSIIFLTQNLFRFGFDKMWSKNLIRALLIFLFVFQFYQLMFHSWVSDSYKSQRTKIMKQELGSLTLSKPFFIYQAPETVIFLPNFNYYQYFSGTVSTQFGQENLKILEKGEDVLVITKKDLFSSSQQLFSKYHLLKEFDRYVVLSR